MRSWIASPVPPLGVSEMGEWFAENWRWFVPTVYVIGIFAMSVLFGFSESDEDDTDLTVFLCVFWPLVIGGSALFLLVLTPRYIVKRLRAPPPPKP